jgi:tetratricopeptide (TPR) repeat protein
VISISRGRDVHCHGTDCGCCGHPDIDARSSGAFRVELKGYEHPWYAPRLRGRHATDSCAGAARTATDPGPELCSGPQLYRQAVGQGDASASDYSNLAALELRANRIEPAAALLEQALQLAPNNAEAWLNLGTA